MYRLMIEGERDREGERGRGERLPTPIQYYALNHGCLWVSIFAALADSPLKISVS